MLIAIVVLALNDKLTEWAAIALASIKALFDVSNGYENYQYHQTQRKEIEHEVRGLNDNDLADRANTILK